MKMNVLEFIFLKSLILILFLTLTIRAQAPAGSQEKKGPGISACSLYGYHDGICSDTVPLSNDIIPKECTSIFYDGLTVDEWNHVEFSYLEGDDKGYVDQLLQSGKPVYMYFGQLNQAVWSLVLGCNGTILDNTGIESLKIYMTDHPGIKGLIFKLLEFDEYSIACSGYTEKLIAYIQLMKDAFPNLEIAIELVGSFLIEHYARPYLLWLDFGILDSSLDFYVISFCMFNYCENQYIAGGIVPVAGNAPHTMTKVQDVLQQIGVPSEKTYYSIRLVASTELDIPMCNITYQEICTNLKGTSGLCADTTSSFYEKGKFIKEKAAGFVGSVIDFADPYSVCNCSRPFPPFYDLLDGFNGSPAPKPCDLMDRIGL